MAIRNLVYFIIGITAVIFSNSVCADDSAKNIFVSDAWVQAMPPSQKTTAVYMTIANNSQKEVILTSASCDIAGNAEIHQMSQANGMMNMAMVPEVHIPAQDKVVLKPGGFHIMLINLKKPVKKDDIVLITLHFQDGSTVDVSAQVKMQENEKFSAMSDMKM